MKQDAKLPALLVRERAGERVKFHGARAVSCAELIEVVTGTTKEKATALLANVEGSLRKIAALPLAVLQARVGKAGAVKLTAALELGRRMGAETRDEGAPVRWPRDVFQIMAPKMEDLPVEEFHVLILDSQHRLERDVTVTRGILNSSLVHPREVFREAIAHNAAAIILVHNHPSGDPTPSADDRAVTDQLVQAGKLLDIPVQDHIIIGRGRYVSFAEAGLL